MAAVSGRRLPAIPSRTVNGRCASIVWPFGTIAAKCTFIRPRIHLSTARRLRRHSLNKECSASGNLLADAVTVKVSGREAPSVAVLAAVFRWESEAEYPEHEYNSTCSDLVSLSARFIHAGPVPIVSGGAIGQNPPPMRSRQRAMCRFTGPGRSGIYRARGANRKHLARSGVVRSSHRVRDDHLVAHDPVRCNQQARERIPATPMAATIPNPASLHSDAVTQ